MKKFRVELHIMTEQTVFYELEAENREHLDKMLETGCPQDYGKCVCEYEPVYCHEEIIDINEVKQ